MFHNFRRTAAVVLTSAVAVSTLLAASAASTPKNLSSNFTLVNLVAGANNGQITYVKPDGSQWRTAESFSFAAIGDQLIKRQYDDAALTAGSGSVVVSTDGPVGAVVQIQARNGQVPTSGAYVGVSEGATTANVPLVSRKGNSASGATNSQIIIQNASSIAINVEVDLISLADGSVAHTETFNNIAPNASVEYDLDEETDLPAPFFGSASIRSTTTGGEVAVVSNFFTGPDAMQTFNAFTTVGRKWFAPLFTSRLVNTLSTPITVQNVSGADIAAGGIDLKCTKDPGAAGPETITTSNSAVVKNNASVAFNPVTDNTTFPNEWFGSCVVTSDADTVMFVQMRFVSGSRAGAYEGILGTSTNQRVVIPLYAKRLPSNGFASAVTIQNLSETAAAHVTLEYKGAAGSDPSCNLTKSNIEIKAGGSLIQNHRTEGGVPEIKDGCVGTLTVTSSDQPIDAFVQLDFLTQSGDPFMAHNAFTVAAN